METITAEERAAHIVDMFHRMTVHHTLWFREVEHQLAAVQRVLGLHQLHLQPVAGDALLTGVVGALFVLAVLAHPADIHAVGHAGDGFQRLGDGGIRQLQHALHHLAALNAAGGLHNHVFAGFDVGPGGIKIIAFAVFLETDRNDFFHSVPRFCIG